MRDIRLEQVRRDLAADFVVDVLDGDIVVFLAVKMDGWDIEFFALVGLFDLFLGKCDPVLLALVKEAKGG